MIRLLNRYHGGGHQIADAIRRLGTEAGNLAGFPMPGSHGSRYDKYVEWLTETEAQLSGQIDDRDIERLLYTKRYRMMVARGRVANHDRMLEMEIRYLRDTFQQIATQIQADGQRLDEYSAAILLDTNVYLHHKDPVDQIDFTAYDIDGSKVYNGGDLAIILPLVVLDEMDNLKDRGHPPIRARARETLRLLDTAFAKKSFSKGQLSAEIRPNLWVEVVLDPPGHVRLPITDDEIVDQAVTVGRYTFTTLKVLTFDLAMAWRSRNAGVATKWLPPEDRHSAS